MKKQVVIIHGGDTFQNYKEYLSFLTDFVIDSLDYFKGKKWKDSIHEELGEEYEVIAPKMPNKNNAKYEEWKIWFEKLIPFLNNNLILIGHSLGGIFLAKYLSENIFPKKIKATYLIAAPYDETDADYTLADFTLPEHLTKFQKQSDEIFIYHSRDDDVVPFVDLEKYKVQLPTAHYLIFNDRGHFNQDHFPELLESIKSLN